MKQLSSFMVLNVNGGDRISFTYDEINDDTGMLESGNKKENFFAIDPELKSHIEAIRDYIRDNKLSE